MAARKKKLTKADRAMLFRLGLIRYEAAVLRAEGALEPQDDPEPPGKTPLSVDAARELVRRAPPACPRRAVPKSTPHG